jgi:hypothetical protein
MQCSAAPPLFVEAVLSGENGTLQLLSKERDAVSKVFG